MAQEWEGGVARLTALEDEGEGATEGRRSAQELYPALFAMVEAMSGGEQFARRCWLLSRQALNHFECEEAGAAAELQAALEAHAQLPAEDARGLEPELIRLLNALGFQAVNASRVEEGLQLLERAWSIGQRAEAAQARAAEKAITLTLFYLAQTHAQAGNRDRAAEYCGLTLVRQLAAPGCTPPGELVNNALGLAQYYSDEHRFRQALWLLRIAESALARAVAESASLVLMRGNVQRSLFTFNLELILAAPAEADFAAADTAVNLLPLSALASAERALPDPLRIARSYAELKPLFAAALDSYERAKRALAHGQTSDLCEAVKAQSELWAAALPAEKDMVRTEAIHRRRIDAVEAVLAELNPAAYARQRVELSSYAAEAAASLFDLLRERLVADKRPKSAARMNECGRKALAHWEVVLEHFRLQEADDAGSLQTFVNCNYSKARILAHLQAADRPAARSHLVQALACYDTVRERVRAHRQRHGAIDAKLEQQLQLTEEFAGLLAKKIQLLG